MADDRESQKTDVTDEIGRAQNEDVDTDEFDDEDDDEVDEEDDVAEGE